MILQSVAVISITYLHVMVTCCISLTINIYILKCITQIPALELSLSVPLVLQAVFRRAGARGLIYDFLLLSCGIRLLMFQPCFDRILICQLFGPWYSTLHCGNHKALVFPLTLYVSRIHCFPNDTEPCVHYLSLEEKLTVSVSPAVTRSPEESAVGICEKEVEDTVYYISSTFPKHCGGPPECTLV